MQLITKTFTLIFQTGVHNYACGKWNRKSANQKTFANLQMHFTQSQREVHQLQSATRQAGYTTNNTIPEEQEEEEIRHRMAAALKTLLYATNHDFTAVTNSSTSNID
eukprot:1549608-Ditylum_brightwellii.AAC.1